MTSCPSVFLPSFFSSIVLSGGTNQIRLFEGFSERLTREFFGGPWSLVVLILLGILLHQTVSTFIAWTGGSAVSRVPSLKSWYVTNEECTQGVEFLDYL